MRTLFIAVTVCAVAIYLLRTKKSEISGPVGFGSPTMGAKFTLPGRTGSVYLANVTAFGGAPGWHAIAMDDQFNFSQLKAEAPVIESKAREVLVRLSKKSKNPKYNNSSLITVSLLEVSAPDHITVRTFEFLTGGKVKQDVRAALAAAMIHDQLLFKNLPVQSTRPGQHHPLTISLGWQATLQINYINDWAHYYLTKAMVQAPHYDGLHDQFANLSKAFPSA